MLGPILVPVAVILLALILWAVVAIFAGVAWAHVYQVLRGHPDDSEDPNSQVLWAEFEHTGDGSEWR
jgi:hypothetical protein